MKSKIVIFLLLGFIGNYSNAQRPSFVIVKNHQFFINNKPYYFVGANYWYGSLLSLKKNKQRGIERLRKELDFLKSKGVTNLRVLAGAEGKGLVNGIDRVGPPLQTAKGIFDADFLRGLDALLFEMGKRNMKAVIYLSNNWEWSGGFLQYLKWNGAIEDSVFKRTMSWDELRDQISKFYDCKPCMEDYLKQVDYVIGRTNSLNQKKYVNDPTIMAWELANEPRPMRPSAIGSYEKWVKETAAFIKSKDVNHLVTLGTEGYIGTENMGIYERIHKDKNVDYLTTHIWPKNWGWFTGKNISGAMDTVIENTMQYIYAHENVAKKLNKPLVIEEFGLPRDGLSFDINSTTTQRDIYYKKILSEWKKNKNEDWVLAGVNFWGYGGMAKPIPGQVFWKEGDDYMCDPPMEEQGLNSVFNSDKSTWAVIDSALQHTGSNSILNKLPPRKLQHIK